jgi:multiple sugar transport system permease protein
MTTLSAAPPPATRAPSSGPKSRAPWKRGDARWGLLLIGPQLAGTFLFVIVPLVAGLLLAFTDWDGLTQAHFVGLANFVDQLTDPLFQRAVLNTVAIALITIPIGLGLAILLATALHELRLRAVYLILIVAPVVTSSVAVAIIWQQLFRTDGPLSSVISTVFGVDPPAWLADPALALIALCIVIVWSSLGLNVLIFMAGLQAINPSILEAASVDGAGALASFFRVRLPLLSPTIFFSVVVAAISSLQTFDTAYILVKNGGPDNATRTIVLHVYDIGFHRFEFGAASAAALLLLILTLAITLVQFAFQKRFVHYES